MGDILLSPSPCTLTQVNSKPGQKKYILRSEIMYDRDPDTIPADDLSPEEAQKKEEFMRNYNAAVAMQNEGKFKQAMELYATAIRVNPKLAAHYGL